jgi:hypothetical protein
MVLMATQREQLTAADRLRHLQFALVQKDGIFWNKLAAERIA